MKKIIALSIGLLIASGCVNNTNNDGYNAVSSVQIDKYESKPFEKDQNKPIGWNFYQEADDYIFKCNLIASSGYRIFQTIHDLSVQDQYTDNLIACVRDANGYVPNSYKEFQASKSSKKVKDSGENFYKRWATYINSLSTYDPEDKELQREYKKALSDFAIDLK